MIEIKPFDKPLRGVINVPADKSISHRAIILSALCDQPVEIVNCLDAADTRATVRCMQALGANIQRHGNSLLVTGGALRPSSSPLDAANSGTTARLLTGLLAAQPFHSIIIGDFSLSKRPMARVIKPLKEMGAVLAALHDNFLPIDIKPATLHGIVYSLPVPSAQVKSAILLAALFANGVTSIFEPFPSRDHTENLLAVFNAHISRHQRTISLLPSTLTPPSCITVPADFSSAAFFIVLASLIPNSRLTLTNVGINPTRTGLLNVLCKMGAKVDITNRRGGAEPYADLTVYAADLHAVDFDADPSLIDEIPILAVAAVFFTVSC